MQGLPVRGIFAIGMLLLACHSASAQHPLQLKQHATITSEEKTYTFNLDNVLVQDALRILARTTSLDLVYTPDILRGLRTRCNAEDEPAAAILKCILKGTGLYAEEHPSGVFIIRSDTKYQDPFSPVFQPDDEQYTISGFVSDHDNGERLIGATIYVLGSEVGTITNNYGFYSITLPADTVYLRYSYLGYDSQDFEVALSKDIRIDIDLEIKAVGLDEVEVIAERSGELVESTQMGSVSIPIENIKQIPAFLGESDVLKALQLMPGVQSGNEGTSGLYVRGGGPDQNLILLDGAPVYNASHIFGFFSVFNPDALQHVQLTKGGFPARYGGRLSSVLDMTMKEGNLKKFEADAALGLIFSKLTIQGPIQKDKMSFLLSGRRTYIDVLARPFINRQSEIEDAVFNFGDLNAKLNYIASPRSRFYTSFYFGQDAFGDGYTDEFQDGIKETSTTRVDWGNLTATARWNYLFSDKLFANTTFTYTRYKFDVGLSIKETFPTDSVSTSAIRYFSGINDISGKIDIDYLPSPNHAIRFGGHLVQHDFNPGVGQFESSEPDASLNIEFTSDSTRFKGTEYAVYLEDDWRLTSRLKANFGVHASGMHVKGTTYTSIQPRIALRYLIRYNWSAKASFGTMQQYLHLLSNSGIGLPTDLWVAATDRIPPQESWQAAIGVTHSIENGGWEASLEGYYKDMQQLIEYLPGANFLSPAENWQDKVTLGNGRSYGLELFIQKKRGRTTGWIGYTLSKSERTFEELNEGEAFPYRYDRRHDVSLVLTHKLSRRWDASATWVYGTGNAITLATARFGYRAPDEDIFSSFSGSNNLYYGKRNSFRMAPYHRLDLGFKLTRGRTIWSFSVYNAYNRKNPFFYYATTNSEGQNIYNQVSLFPILPSITWSYKY